MPHQYMPQSIGWDTMAQNRHIKTYLVTLTIDWIESCEVSGRQHQSASYALPIKQRIISANSGKHDALQKYKLTENR